MSELRITQEDKSSWTVSGPGLILTGLRREAASAFVETYIRCRKKAEIRWVRALPFALRSGSSCRWRPGKTVLRASETAD